jgi:hypothetical protein
MHARRLALALAFALAPSVVVAQEKAEGPEVVAPVSSLVVAQEKAEDPEVVAIKKRLARHVRTRCHDGELVEEAIHALLDQMDGGSVSFVVDPSVVGRKVSVKSNEASVKAALTEMAGGVGAQWEIWRGVIFITSKKKPLEEPPAPALSDDAKKKCAATFTLNLEDTPLSEVASFLKKISGLSIEVPRELEDVKVRHRVRERTLAQHLDLICRRHGLEIQRAGDSLAFVKR